MLKRYRIVLISLMLVSTLGGSCSNHTQIKEKEVMKTQAEIYFAGGCFWGTEHFMKQIAGVYVTQAGYANGTVENPTYKQVCSGATGFAETVQVVYDKEQIALSDLLQLYFKTIDPTTLNRQGGDVGTQYRTGIYYTDKADLEIIKTELAKLAESYNKPLRIEVEPLKNFYPAEDYHQDYLDNNPTGYCHINPKLFQLAREFKPSKKQTKPDEAELRKLLTPLQYEVTQKNGTEPPFQNAYFDEFRPGIYVDIVTGEPLFVSSDKFESGCGWPSFSKPIDGSRIAERTDKSHGMERVEVRSSVGDSHLGHVFTDGPAESGGLRYCINSAALRFVPKEKMAAEGYADYLDLVEDKK